MYTINPGLLLAEPSPPNAAGDLSPTNLGVSGDMKHSHQCNLLLCLLSIQLQTAPCLETSPITESPNFQNLPSLSEAFRNEDWAPAPLTNPSAFLDADYTCGSRAFQVFAVSSTFPRNDFPRNALVIRSQMKQALTKCVFSAFKIVSLYRRVTRPYSLAAEERPSQRRRSTGTPCPTAQQCCVQNPGPVPRRPTLAQVWGCARPVGGRQRLFPRTDGCEPGGRHGCRRTRGRLRT